ncbi:hypothetical protein [Lentilactobacillus sp. SPB1-3]|uniref:Uncharacterized protein n=1 Tax=Lentilactobacillus terminaliae TaxID=3003483 RepID=A0ACD5DDH6_9LACO|nr:hypothetical protein [Lentilactobacillus sp. SPB1-3]MCZ0978126.1 hypothetical protein [Lentilactobacillus sp. SPB1-3]
MGAHIEKQLVTGVKQGGTMIYDNQPIPLWQGPNAFINVETNVPLALNSVTIPLTKPISTLKTGLKFVSSRGDDGGVKAVYLPNKNYMASSTDYTQVTSDKNVIDTDYPLEVTINAALLISNKSVQFLPAKTSTTKDIYQVFVDYVNDTTIKFRTVINGINADKTMLHTDYANSTDKYNAYPIVDKIVEV